MTTKAKAKPAKKSRKAAPAKKVRDGSKTEVVKGLLTRKEGCTTADILSVTGWPTVSVPAMARAAGLTLRKEKKDRTTTYWAS